jgi:two-component system alkaline phosphatase synthesis response regulator PhoP
MTPETLKIVMVDPDPNITGPVQEYFARTGMKVFVAESRQEALTEIREAAPHVVILERKLPDIDGLALCRQLKGDEGTKQIPIIFLTALDDVVDKVLGLEAGASAYITKPFSLRELDAWIKAVHRARNLDYPSTIQELPGEF